MRVFIAADLPPAVRDALQGIQRDLRGRGLDLRWVRPEGIHLTLRFLGESRQEQIDRLVVELEPLVASFEPLALGLGDGGAFPPSGLPRVVWTGVTGDTVRLALLARRIEGAVVGCGWSAESRAFHPHLTLARVAPGAGGRRLKSLIESPDPPALSPGPESPGFVVDEIVLFRSHLERGGARYTPLALFPLKGTGAT